MVRGNLIVAGIINLSVLALVISNVGLRCENEYLDAARKYTDAPILESSRRWTNDNDEYGGGTQEEDAAATAYSSIEPSYLNWDVAPVNIPSDWSYQNPTSCKANITDFAKTTHYDPTNQKIIVHYHMQHNAGTNFFFLAKKFTPCATRACWQESKHCFVSMNEEVEATNIRNNYKEYGIQYVSYEVMLPPRFPLPFVSESAREGLFFTTIVRDPFKRFLTYYRRQFKDKAKNGGADPGAAFWRDFQGKQNIYAGDNLNARWLSGAREHISQDSVNVAKCRLQLFDLVIADKLYDYAVKKVMCPLNNWKGKTDCDEEITKAEHTSKPDPLKDMVDPAMIGAWIERLRPSFEIYDYARILSWKQLQEKGVENLPQLSEMPSYMDTLSRYTGMKVEPGHFKKMPYVSVANEEHFSPPVEFCEHMKQVWMNNPDEVPNAYGIGTIMNSFHPIFESKKKDEK